jgi:hypothetical protein
MEEISIDCVQSKDKKLVINLRTMEGWNTVDHTHFIIDTTRKNSEETPNQKNSNKTKRLLLNLYLYDVTTFECAFLNDRDYVIITLYDSFSKTTIDIDSFEIKVITESPDDVTTLDGKITIYKSTLRGRMNDTSQYFQLKVLYSMPLNGGTLSWTDVYDARHSLNRTNAVIIKSTLSNLHEYNVKEVTTSINEDCDRLIRLENPQHRGGIEGTMELGCKTIPKELIFLGHRADDSPIDLLSDSD